MEDKVRELLDARIEDQIEHLNTLNRNSEEYAKGIENLVQLGKLRIEEKKLDNEFHLKRDAQDSEDVYRSKDLEMKNTDIHWQKVVRWISLGIEAAGIIIPVVSYGRWWREGLAFEKDGSISSAAVRSLERLLKPRR